MPSVLGLFLIFSASLFQAPVPAFPRDGATQIIDNPRVTVWDVRLAKGQATPMHRHDYDTVVVFPSGGAIQTRSGEGAGRVASHVAGAALFQSKGVTHSEEGASSEPTRAIVIELKDLAVAPILNTTKYPNAFPDRPGAKKVIDNDRVVAWDYTWTEGVPTPVHFHDKDVVVVFLEEGTLRSTTPTGEVTFNEITVGKTMFNPRARLHVEELVKGKARALIVELK